jgi:hypothetical protein
VLAYLLNLRRSWQHKLLLKKFLKYEGLCSKRIGLPSHAQVSGIKILGSRQVVRHRILIPAFVGSIPTSPAILFLKQCIRLRCLTRKRACSFFQAIISGKHNMSYDSLMVFTGNANPKLHRMLSSISIFIWASHCWPFFRRRDHGGNS